MSGEKRGKNNGKETGDCGAINRKGPCSHLHVVANLNMSHFVTM